MAMQDNGMLTMIADHMEKGFLENIIDMFKHDRRLYPIVPAMMSDERSRVRIGTVVLIETLRDEHREEMAGLIPGIGQLLKHETPAIRADAAHLLSIIGHRDALPYLREAEHDDIEPVRQVILESIQEIEEAA
jgi:hypothetical protein